MGLKEGKYRWLKRFNDFRKRERERERVFKKYIHTYISRNGININRCVRLYRILVIKKPFEFPQNSKQ